MELEKLTKEKAIEAIEEIKAIAYDDEMAHAEEDNLMDWFIKCVSESMYTIDEAIEIANIVRTTNDIQFSRWYA